MTDSELFAFGKREYAEAIYRFPALAKPQLRRSTEESCSRRVTTTS
ncbi:MAG: hypothetical protein ABI667_00135 [Sphingomicrobium sp.]